MAIGQFNQITGYKLVFIPSFRPEHRSFWRKRPVGERQGCRSFSQGQGRPFENPRQKREAQDKGGIRVTFLLVTFLWPNKEKSLGCWSEHRHINSRRDSDTNANTKFTRNVE
jgi:hypothetical protein